MSAPPEYIEALNVYRLCQVYQALPAAGGVLDQDVELLRIHAVLNEGGYFGEPERPPAAFDPFAGLPMESL